MQLPAAVKLAAGGNALGELHRRTAQPARRAQAPSRGRAGLQQIVIATVTITGLCGHTNPSFYNVGHNSHRTTDAADHPTIFLASVSNHVFH